jgi:pyruvate kinase
MSMRRNRNAKIIATLGPASSSRDVIRRLFEEGADVFRLNFSHGTQENHARRYRIIRELERETGRPIGVPFRLDLDAAAGDERRVSVPTQKSLRLSPPASSCCSTTARSGLPSKRAAHAMRRRALSSAAPCRTGKV